MMVTIKYSLADETVVTVQSPNLESLINDLKEAQKEKLIVLSIEGVLSNDLY